MSSLHQCFLHSKSALLFLCSAATADPVVPAVVAPAAVVAVPVAAVVAAPAAVAAPVAVGFVAAAPVAVGFVAAAPVAAGPVVAADPVAADPVAAGPAAVVPAAPVAPDFPPHSDPDSHPYLPAGIHEPHPIPAHTAKIPSVKVLRAPLA